jgi:hypothetical protein
MSGLQPGCPGRATTAPRGREPDDVTSVRTVSPRSQHANLAARICGIFIQTTQRSGFCAALGVGNRFHTALIAGLNWFSPQLSRISLRSELAGDPAEDEAESLGSVASIISLFRHEWDHERGGLHEGAKGLQGCADGYC